MQRGMPSILVPIAEATTRINLMCNARTFVVGMDLRSQAIHLYCCYSLYRGHHRPIAKSQLRRNLNIDLFEADPIESDTLDLADAAGPNDVE